MPRGARGQQITFALEFDPDQGFGGWHQINVKVGDTIRKISSSHPEYVGAILTRNKIRSATAVLRHRPKKKRDRKHIMVPGKVRSNNEFSVLAGDEPPRVVGGYAKFSTVDRPERVGVEAFDGYDPIELEVPIQFEAWADGDGLDGSDNERKIRKLEYMAGRGKSADATGPPPVVHVTVTDNDGKPVNLIPSSYQRNAANPTGPLWRVVGLSWDDGALRDDLGNRVRTSCTVTLRQHTKVKLLQRSIVKGK